MLAVPASGRCGKIHDAGDHKWWYQLDTPLVKMKDATMGDDESSPAAFTFHRVDCETWYNMLRMVLLEYAQLLASVEVEIFAIEMEKGPGSSDSTDPALWDEFRKNCKEGCSVSEMLESVASFVERELVLLLHVETAKQVVLDLRVASLSPHSAPEPLRTRFALDASTHGES